MTAQLLGGTVGMAVLSTIFLTTLEFEVVFLATAGFLFAVLGLGWLTIERDGRSVARP